jgi:glycosyltransferase involved in cell wall biosynthesis
VFAGDLGTAAAVDGLRRFVRRVLPRVRRAVPHAELLVTGTHPTPAIRALAGPPGVRVAAAVDLRPSLWSATAAVSPAAVGAGRTKTLLETMALGTPLVASPDSLATLPDVLAGHHALVADDDDAMVESILLLLGNPVIAATLARNARELVERRYTWRSMAQRYQAVHVRVASARAVPTVRRAA